MAKSKSNIDRLIKVIDSIIKLSIDGGTHFGCYLFEEGKYSYNTWGSTSISRMTIGEIGSGEVLWDSEYTSEERIKVKGYLKRDYTDSEIETLILRFEEVILINV